jgi:hypothetical protein
MAENNLVFMTEHLSYFYFGRKKGSSEASGGDNIRLTCARARLKTAETESTHGHATSRETAAAEPRRAHSPVTEIPAKHEQDNRVHDKPPLPITHTKHM